MLDKIEQFNRQVTPEIQLKRQTAVPYFHV